MLFDFLLVNEATVSCKCKTQIGKRKGIVHRILCAISEISWILNDLFLLARALTQKQNKQLSKKNN